MDSDVSVFLSLHLTSDSVIMSSSARSIITSFHVNCWSTIIDNDGYGCIIVYTVIVCISIDVKAFSLDRRVVLSIDKNDIVK